MSESDHFELPEEIAGAENLPTIPAVALEVLRLTEDEDSSIEDLAAALGKDPALAGKILKLANSGVFGLGTDVATLERATMVLGLKTVKLMSLSFSLVAALPSSGSGRFDYESYWKRSIVTAVAARRIAAELDPMLSDQVFLIGLLSHLGQMVINEAMPDEYARVIDEAKGEWPSPEVEKEVLGFGSPQVAASLLQSWSLPVSICDPIRWHRDPSGLSSEDEALHKVTRIVHLGCIASELVCADAKASALERWFQDAEEYFSLPPEETEPLLAEVDENVASTADTLDMEISDPVSVAKVMAQAQEQLVRVSLGVASEMQAVKRQAKDLEDKASTDALTGLPNRASFDRKLEESLENRMAGNADGALAVLIMDIDHFKSFNDTYGHQAGDQVLKEVADRMKEVMRPTDHPARYGGEEFVVVMPEANAVGMRALGERVREAICGKPFSLGEEEVDVTMSVGGALTERVTKMTDGERLVGVADRYLYDAKKAGRNRCCFFPGSDVSESS